MPVFKCKMCGGALEFAPGTSVGVCDSCGTKQTLPRLDDDRKANLFDRANHFRRNNDFDKAMSIYEQILNEDHTDAEAYWSLVLCRYGIEYVEDPETHKRLPTVNRTQYTSVYADEDYKSAMQYADAEQKEIYEAEAKVIDGIQKNILEISQKEEPFDVFICYKETDADGRRTQDSVLANELYHQLTQEGFKVFFSRITLEDKLGQEYEPYIFAALNSAKVMVVLGTKAEYFNAVWVKNEWSRFLALIRNGAKKTLVPAYRDMDPYDLPDEFSHLQAQDMSRLGFMQDLIRGIGKLASANAPAERPAAPVYAAPASGAAIAPLLKRANMALEDGEWERADEFCEQALNQDPENAQAYLVKLMAELHVVRQEDLREQSDPFDGSANFKKAIRFADPTLKETLEGYIAYINERIEEERLEHIYQDAFSLYRDATTENECNCAAEQFESIAGYKDAEDLTAKCREKAKEKAKADAKVWRAFWIALGAVLLIIIGISIGVTFHQQSDSYIFGLEKSDGEVILTTYRGDATDVIIPDNVTSIGYDAFRDCAALTSVTIGNNVTSIKSSAFYGCCNLTRVTIPDSVTSIGSNAFRGCPITTATIPMTAIEYIPKGNLQVVGINGGTSIGANAFSGCTNLTSVTIPDSITSIGDSAFSECTDLTSITVPSSVTSIGNCAFYGCAGLTNVTIPNGVTNIGNYVFYGCTGLTSVTIPKSVTSIGDYAFSGCTGLTSVTIPESVTSIGSNAFRGCNNLEKMIFANPNGWWYAETSTATSGTSVTGFSDRAMAAKYLRLIYCGYYWHRRAERVLPGFPNVPW